MVSVLRENIKKLPGTDAGPGKLGDQGERIAEDRDAEIEAFARSERGLILDGFGKRLRADGRTGLLDGERQALPHAGFGSEKQSDRSDGDQRDGPQSVAAEIAAAEHRQPQQAADGDQHDAGAADRPGGDGPQADGGGGEREREDPEAFVAKCLQHAAKAADRAHGEVGGTVVAIREKPEMWCAEGAGEVRRILCEPGDHRIAGDAQREHQRPQAELGSRGPVARQPQAGEQGDGKQRECFRRLARLDGHQGAGRHAQRLKLGPPLRHLKPAGGQERRGSSQHERQRQAPPDRGQRHL